jgi:hypothetical protein
VFELTEVRRGAVGRRGGGPINQSAIRYEEQTEPGRLEVGEARKEGDDVVTIWGSGSLTCCGDQTGVATGSTDMDRGEQTLASCTSCTKILLGRYLSRQIAPANTAVIL